MSKKKNQQPDYTDLIIEHGICPETRTIDCSGEVDERMYRKLLRGLRILNNQDKEKPIKLILNSLGGSVWDGFAIFDLLRSFPTPIDIHVAGSCASMAVVILQAGRYRTASPTSRFLVHAGSVGAAGDVERVYESIHADKEDREMMKTIIMTRANKKFKYPKGDLYFWADQAVAWGIIDEIQ